MGTTLTGTTPQDTYDSLIKVTDNGPLTGSLKKLTDGLGNDSALSLSTGAASITGTLAVSGATTLGVSTALNWGARGGITQDASYNFSWSTNGVANAFNITSATGNVGIGTASPDNVLDLGAPAAGRALTWDNSNSLFSSYSGGSLVLSSNFYGSTSTDTYLTSNTATFGAAGIRVGANDGAGNSGLIRFFADTAAAKTAGAAFTPTERVRIDPDGLKFNGDTAAANALDDYEEGEWTMGVSFGGGTTGITYANNKGTYTKIGRQVTVNGLLTLTSKGSSTGNAKITGLPFTIPNKVENYSTVALYFEKIVFADQFQGIGAIGTTTIELYDVTTLGATNTSITDAEFANDSQIIVSFTYFV